MKTAHNRLPFQAVAAWLIATLVWSPPACALRPLGAEKAGLEEDLRQSLTAGLEEPTEAEVQAVVRTVWEEADPAALIGAIRRVREWYGHPSAEQWRALSAQGGPLLAGLLFRLGENNPEGVSIAQDSRLQSRFAIGAMMRAGVTLALLGLPEEISESQLKWFRAVLAYLQERYEEEMLSLQARMLLVVDLLRQVIKSENEGPLLVGSQEQITEELAARAVAASIYDADTGPDDQKMLLAMLALIRPDQAARIRAALDKPDSGLEERETMTAEEFGRRQNGRLDVLAEHGENVEGLLGRADVRVAVVNLPRYLPLYVQGGALLWAVQDHFNNRQVLSGVIFPIVLLPVEHWKDLGLILQDPMEEWVRDNPKGLPVREVYLQDVPELTLLDLLAEIFRRRLGIPESDYLGSLVYRAEEGQAKLALFSA